VTLHDVLAKLSQGVSLNLGERSVGAEYFNPDRAVIQVFKDSPSRDSCVVGDVLFFFKLDHASVLPDKVVDRDVVLLGEELFDVLPGGVGGTSRVVNQNHETLIPWLGFPHDLTFDNHLILG